MIGIGLFFFAAPQQVPDYGASVHIPRSEAIERARSFGEAAARMQLEDAQAQAVIRRKRDLLDTLQHRMGRREAIQHIRSSGVPAYFWRVEWTEDAENGSDEIATVDLTLSGHPIGLTTQADAVTPSLRHDEALASIRDTLAASDSLPLPDRLSFRFDDERSEGTPRPRSETDRAVLGRSGIAQLARYHLQSTFFAERGYRVDSVFVSGEDGVVTATVRVSATAVEPDGEWFSADVELRPAGTLVSLDSRFVRSTEQRPGMSGEDVFELGTLFLFALLGLILVVVFFRRINARLIDTRTALRDATIGGVAAAISMSTEVVSTEVPGSMVDLAVVVVGTVLTAFAAAAFVFFISGAANSVARHRWEDKLRSLDLARQFFVRNVPVGLSLVRGVLGGLALVGLAVLALLLIPQLEVRFSDDRALFATPFAGASAIQAIAGRFFYALFATYTVILGIGGLLQLRAKRAAVPIVGMVLVLALLRISPVSLRPLSLEIVISGLLGAGIVWMFWRHDTLSAMTALFVLVLVVVALPGWSVPSAPEIIGSIVIVSVPAALLLLGLTGALGDKTSEEVPVIIPEYIEELASRERLKRELELAREVQVSFLPASSPECRGLDIASVCLPAHEVGGDYYDFFPISDGRLGVVVGDVSGKGMQAAFYMTLMKGILQSMTTDSLGPAAILTRANGLFRINAPRGTFMSMVLGIFDVGAKTWTFARAGHNPVLVHRAAADRPDVIQPNGAAIGLTSNSIFAGSLEERTITIAAGDLLLIYTDGVTEAMNLKRALYDDKRLQEVVARCKGRTAQEVIEAIIDDVHAFSGAAPRHDDMTMVAVRVTSNA